ncbi:MAG: hypothetical protein R3Y29_06890 [bacterium]
MIKISPTFKTLLENLKNIENQQITQENKIINMCDNIISRINIIEQCYLLKETDEISTIKVLKRLYTDYTGIESTINTIDICYKEDILLLNILIFLEIFYSKITSKYKNDRFNLIFCSHEEFGTFRFHMIRDYEPLWIDLEFVRNTKELIICINDDE